MYKLNKSVEKIELNNQMFLANFETGAMVLLDNARKKILDNVSAQRTLREEIFINDQEFLEKMLDGGYFDTIEQPLASAYLHVTNICNLNCIGCYSYDRTRNCKNKLSLKQVQYIIRELVDNGVEQITISGGEPLIREDLVSILEYAKEVGVQRIFLITNGTVYKPQLLEKLKPFIDELAVSIDGYSYENPHFLRDKGTFPKVIEFVKLAKKKNMPVAILPTLHQKNIEAMGEYMKLSHQLEVPISFSLLTCSGELKDYIPTENNLQYLADFLTKFMKKETVPLNDYSTLEAKKDCGAGSSIISVTAEGDVYPCHMMHDTNTKMGNILETPLKKILQSASRVPCVENVEKCKDCSVRYVCGGGCKARALLLNGNWSQPDPYCRLNKSFYQSYIKEKRSIG